VVRYHAKAAERSLDVMRWGLVPYWSRKNSGAAEAALIQTVQNMVVKFKSPEESAPLFELREEGE
jgi:hypothetical protein